MLSKKKTSTITFRLRQIDADIVAAIEGIDTSSLSDLCRDGLRMILGIKTTKRVEVSERPLETVKTRSVEVQGKPAVFIPGKGVRK